jgi:hypothetical protein
MATSFGQRSAEKLKKYDYPLYFQFKIGEDYRYDHYLYFEKKPTAEQYRNDIFNKIDEYFPEKVPDYLVFHYNAYQGGKETFLSFLQIELPDRITKTSDPEFKKKLRVAVQWVEKMQQEIKPSEGFMDNGDFMHADIAKGISLNNKNHEARLFQLLVLICEIKAPGKTSTDKLFDNFTDINLCSLLKTHFEKYRDLQVGTIRRNYLSKYRESFRREMPKAAKLEKALQDFFLLNACY